MIYEIVWRSYKIITQVIVLNSCFKIRPVITLFFFLPRSPNLQCQNVRKMWIISSKRVESLE